MTQALNAGVPRRRRALFGLLDADGWGWASVKAFFWFIVIIFLLGYIPDRAYYFTVNKTIDLGILAWSPVNLCPPANQGLPCPAPAGSILPWEPSPEQLALPAPRTDGALVQVGTRMLYIGGSDGTKASADVSVAVAVQPGNFDKWAKGPALPAPRANMAAAAFGGSIYVVGGTDDAGAPTKTTYVLTPNLQSGELGNWQTAADLKLPIDLPEARTDGALAALADGLLFVGGSDAKAPTTSTWKAKLTGGKLGEWKAQQELLHPVSQGTAALIGNFVWLWGGSDANGPVGGVQRGTVAATGDNQGQIDRWAVSNSQNLPAARANGAGFVANGTLYQVGGDDGSGTKGELYWAIPAAGSDGDQLSGWKHLSAIDLPAPGLEGAAAAVSGSNVFLAGGKSGDRVLASSVRSNLAPQEPFFQVGLVGATVPALKIDGELGQQLGYLNAFSVGLVNFAILIVIGIAFAHREQTAALLRRIFRRR